MSECTALSDLKCPVCYDQIYPPMHMCGNGHTVCPSCLKRLSNRNCPVCRSLIAHNRCFVLEAIYERVMVPCKNVSQGCEARKSGMQMLGHHKVCEFNVIKCPRAYPVGMCKWRGFLSKMFEHLRHECPG